MTRLLKIASEGVDVVLIAVKDDYKRFDVIDAVTDPENGVLDADFRGEVYIAEDIAIPNSFLDLDRPFLG